MHFFRDEPSTSLMPPTKHLCILMVLKYIFQRDARSAPFNNTIWEEFSEPHNVLINTFFKTSENHVTPCKYVKIV